MRKSKYIIFTAVTLALIIFLAVFNYVINNYKTQSKNTVISVQNVATMGASKVTVKDYEEIYKLNEDVRQSAFSGELSSQNVLTTKVIPVIVNHNYLDYNNISYTGEGITETMEKGKTKTAVISKSFSKKFYGTSAIGKTFILNDERYRVTGIYDDKKDTYNRFFCDNKERIYLNYTSVDDYKNQPLHSLSCVEGTRAERQFNTIGIENFERLNFNEKNLVVNDFTSIITFIIGIFIIIYLIRLWVYTLSDSYHFIKLKHSENYFLKMLGKNIVPLALRLIVLIAIPLGIFSVFVIAFSNFHIVYRYIHTDNLFNVSYMLQKLANTLAQEGSMVWGGNPYFINLYNGTLILGLILSPIIILLFLFMYHMFTDISSQNKGFMYLVTVGFAVVTIISLIVSLVSGVSYTFFEITSFITALLIIRCIKDFFIKKAE